MGQFSDDTPVPGGKAAAGRTRKKSLAWIHPAGIARALSLALLLAVPVTISATGGSHGPACNCPVDQADARMVEWDLPMVADLKAGAITVDIHSSRHHGKLWFVTRDGAPRLFSFEPGRPVTKNNAKWKSFDLDEITLTTGGLRRIKVTGDDRAVFLRTHTSLQRIATDKCVGVFPFETCERTTWFDQLTDAGPDLIPHVSDLTTDDCYVYTTTALFDGVTFELLPNRSYLQRLNPASKNADNTTWVTRWEVGGSAGFCATALDSSPCISGVVVDRNKPHLVYFSEPGSGPDPVTGLVADNGRISELNTSNSMVRSWPLIKLGANVWEPRELQFADDGTLASNTGSGHIVKLDTKKYKMSAHQMPEDVLNDSFGLAMDHAGVIGYTGSSQSVNKVGMVFPKGTPKTVYPDSRGATMTQVKVPFEVENAATIIGTSPPQVKTIDARITRKSDGTFVEALMINLATPVAPTGGSFIPLGITPDHEKKVGTFFYGVGSVGAPEAPSAVNRVGQIVLPLKGEKLYQARDEDDFDDDGRKAHEDDDDDGDGIKDAYDTDKDNDCVADSSDYDDDNDGIKDEEDEKGKKETKHAREDDIASQQSIDYPLTVDSNNLLLVASIAVPDLTRPVSIQIYNPAGQLVASSIPLPGLATATTPTFEPGTYTIRVKNHGLGTTASSTSILTRGAWPLLDTLP